MLETAIITAPREHNYLSTMLDSYFQTWEHKPHVFHEPNVSDYFNQSKVIEHHNEQTLGCVGNWWNAAQYMLANTESPFVMMCEDDIEFSEPSRTKILNLLKVLTGEIHNEAVQRNLPIEKIGFISPYCAKLCANGELWHKPSLKKHGWCGALCLIFPRRTLRLLVDNCEEVFNVKSKGGLLDYAIGETCVKHLELVILTHKPTLVLHIGEESTYPSNNKPENKIHDARQPAL